MLATLVALALGGPPPGVDLGAIAARGRALAAYRRAATSANDAVLALEPDARDLTRQVAYRTERGWTVAFGRLDKDRRHFLVTYEATEAGGPDQFRARKVDPPRASSGFELAASLAMDAALGDFLKTNPGRRPYDLAALPAVGGKTWVYVVPAPTRPGTWPLGGDARYLIAPDGSTILERRTLHEAIIEDTPPKGPAAPGKHTHPRGDAPEDTDVAHVLIREPRAPEAVRTPVGAFLIKEDGSIEPR
jgi:hypothetical protein